MSISMERIREISARQKQEFEAYHEEREWWDRQVPPNHVFLYYALMEHLQELGHEPSKNFSRDGYSGFYVPSMERADKLIVGVKTWGWLEPKMKNLYYIVNKIDGEFDMYEFVKTLNWRDNVAQEQMARKRSK